MMIDLSLGYQVLIQPAVLLIALAYAAYQLAKGFTKEDAVVDDVTVQVTRWRGGPRLKRATLAVGLAVVFVLSTVVVPFGHRGVVWTTNGVDFEERPPGLSFIIPVFQSDLILDVRQQRLETIYGPDAGDNAGKANAFVQSSDLQEITVRASLLYRVIPDQAAEVVDDLGSEAEIRNIVQPIFFDGIKEASGQCLPDEQGICQRTALSFATQLSSIAEGIEDIIEPQLTRRGLEVLQVTVEDAVFDPAFIQSVKNKVIADQKAAEQERLVVAARHEAEQVQATADGEAYKQAKEAEGQAAAIASVADALGFTPGEYLSWLQLTRWDGVLPSTLIGDGGGQFGVLLGVEPGGVQ